jgi:hypothetical protein
MKRRFTYYFFVLIIGILLTGCNPKTTVKSTSDKTPQTDECILKEEVCAEALDFQKEYERMPEEEQKDMASVLNTYIEHCEEATKNCEESIKK